MGARTVSRLLYMAAGLGNVVDPASRPAGRRGRRTGVGRSPAWFYTALRCAWRRGRCMGAGAVSRLFLHGASAGVPEFT